MWVAVKGVENKHTLRFTKSQVSTKPVWGKRNYIRMIFNDLICETQCPYSVFLCIYTQYFPLLFGKLRHTEVRIHQCLTTVAQMKDKMCENEGK